MIFIDPFFYLNSLSVWHQSLWCDLLICIDVELRPLGVFLEPIKIVLTHFHRLNFYQNFGIGVIIKL